MGNIVLYSNHCPRCNVLKRKLDAKGVVYTEENDVNVMKAKQFVFLPVLEIDGECYSFAEANKLINEMGES